MQLGHSVALPAAWRVRSRNLACLCYALVNAVQGSNLRADGLGEDLFCTIKDGQKSITFPKSSTADCTALGSGAFGWAVA